MYISHFSFFWNLLFSVSLKVAQLRAGLNGSISRKPFNSPAHGQSPVQVSQAILFPVKCLNLVKVYYWKGFIWMVTPQLFMLMNVGSKIAAGQQLLYLSAIFKHCPGKKRNCFLISQVLRELAFRGVLGHAYPKNLWMILWFSRFYFLFTGNSIFLMFNFL